MSEIMEIANGAIDADSHALTPMEMLDRALSSGASPEQLDKLMALQERWEAKQAKKAYIAALSRARADFQPILKKHSGYGNRYKYEQLFDVGQAIDSALSDQGLSYRWDAEEIEGGRIRVTCIIQHQDGHEERGRSLSCHPDDVADAKANMNGPQRLQTAVTYLERITLKASLGLAAGPDTDGRLDDDESGDFDETPWLEKIKAMTPDNYRAVQAELNESAADMPRKSFEVLRAMFGQTMNRIKKEAENV